MKRRSSNKSKMVTLVTVLLMVLTACSNENGASPSISGGSAEAAAGSKSAEVTVHIARLGGISPLMIAEEKGWIDEAFAEKGAKVEWSNFTSGPPILEALVSNRIDLSSMGDGAVITGLANQLPFEIIGLLGDGKDLNTVIVPVNSTISSVADLKGKTIGVAKGTTSHVYLIKILQSIGLSQDDVKQINLQADDALAAFETGQLDAWITLDPYVTLSVEQKKAKIIEVKGEFLAPLSMIARTGFVKEHPELVTEYLKVYQKTLDWQRDNLDEAAALYEKHSKMPASVIKTVLERSANQLSVYTPEALQAHEASSEILLNNKFLKKKPDFAKAINNTFVEELN
ncbi:sulfonate ABC transporter substrate-binding protein [Paenibacillus sp. J45TS6]|uniref:aliphatic sulfonate ABC transporter substrate-binding protein n=1 Tax=Paenibacillus sp. J45TS6 TaxID=2807196 RepID=UPI001B06190B|nr:aliphatic sulfonate ABC transporter substrate-binding protein [Paenibacillus sp. J45TS6]GIP44374.1 sulfonate ABC transporter substrate-binding protein [Paenibacillus sp. J45TS6]